MEVVRKESDTCSGKHHHAGGREVPSVDVRYVGDGKGRYGADAGGQSLKPVNKIHGVGYGYEPDDCQYVARRDAQIHVSCAEPVCYELDS